MGTRCQVVVISESPSNRDHMNLYHHWDGYPDNMVPLIRKAFRSWTKSESNMTKHRPEKVASFIVAADPNGYEFDSAGEPEYKPHDPSVLDRLFLHCDISYLYVVKVFGGGTWVVTSYVPEDGFWTSPFLSNMSFHDRKTLTPTKPKV